ncbi:hypothetical protein GGI13_002956 [Coemansia sp. RSA 455]|nr:hypothetical protein GGI13_002956 [Coemansia sp. RSA 455]
MKTSFAAITFLFLAVQAQNNPMPASDTASPARQAPVYSSNVVAGQMPQMPSSLTQLLLDRLASYFDMSHLSSIGTTTPLMVTQVFDPTINKFTHLSMNVVQSGDVWYLPVCTINSITAAGASAAPSAPESCQYGIQLIPVPRDAGRMMLRVMRTMFRAIIAAAREPTHL